MRRGTALLLATLLPAAPAAAAEERFVELRTAVFAGPDHADYQLVERARLTFQSELSERWELVGTIEAALHQGRDMSRLVQRTLEASDFGPLLNAGGCVWPKPENPGLGISDVAGYLYVDRLYADYYGTHFDVRAGRQAVHWGSAQFFNPTDPFPEVLLAEPWRARKGINAVSVNVPFGELNDVTAVAAVDDTLRHGRLAARARVNWLETDWAVVGAYRGETEEGLVGLDLKGTLLLGWWLEAALKIGDQIYEELAIGVDYSFPVFENLVLLAQYYRNGSGAENPNDYGRAGAGRSLEAVPPPTCADPRAAEVFAPQGEVDPFAPATAGTDYLMLSVVATLVPEVSASLVGLQNLRDGTALLVPTVTTHPADWLDIGLSGQVALALWGEGGEFKPRPSDLQIVAPVGGRVLRADFSRLVPDATITLWMRGNF